MYDDDITPAGVVRAFWRWLWVGIGVLVLTGALIYAGHAFGWWLSAQDTTHQAINTQNGYSNQSTLRAQVTEKLSEVTSITTQIAANKGDTSLVSALGVQRAAVAGIVCGDAAQIAGTPLPSQQAQWVSANCSDGALAPSSPDYVTGAP